MEKTQCLSAFASSLISRGGSRIFSTGGGGGDFEKFGQKIAFFWRALPLKVSIYWRQRRL